MSNLWFTVVDLPNAPLTKLSLQDVQDIDDLKTAIKTKMPNALASYDAAQLVLKVKRRNEPDNQAHDLADPTQVIADVFQQFGNDCWVLVSLPPGKRATCIPRCYPLAVVVNLIRSCCLRR